MKTFWRLSAFALIGSGLWLLGSQEVSWRDGWGSILFIVGLMLLLATWFLGGVLALLVSPLLLVIGIVRIFSGGGWWHWIIAALAVFVVAISSIAALSGEETESDGPQNPSDLDSQQTDAQPGNTGSLPAPSKIRTQLNPSRVIAGLSPQRSKQAQVSYDRDCSKCGGTSRPGRQFCGVCGEPLEIIEA